MKTNLFSYLTYKININRLDELTNWPPISWVKKFFIQRLIDYSYPEHIFLETTSACNLRCKLCPRTSGETLVGHMDLELFKGMVDEAKKYGPRTFCLHLFGEPLLAPHFIEEIYYIKKVNPQNVIVLTTNGTLLNEKIARAMIEAPVDKIAVSFMSALKEKYLEITGTDLLSLVEENVKKIVVLKKELNKNKPKIIVRLIQEIHDKHEAEIFKQKWKNQNVLVEVRPAHNYGGNVAYGQDRLDNKKKRWPCYHLWLSPAVHWNGDFSVCCDDYARKAVLGNTNTKTVHELWNAPMLKVWRQAQLKGNFHCPKICENCNVWTMYHDVWFDWQKK